MGRYSSLSLEEHVRACGSASDADVWEEFISRFQRPICLSIVRTAHQWFEIPQQVVDDLVQETYLMICADKCSSLRDWADQHPEAILGYVKTIAVNATHDYFKARHSQKRGAGKRQESLEDIAPPVASKSFGSTEAMERHLLLKQIDQFLEVCAAGPDYERDRSIFWLYYQQGMTAKAIANLPVIGLTAKGVESVILRLTRLVRQQVVTLRSNPSAGSEPSKKGFWPAESY
jgi:RNA polymerase sigma-70 factor (ECF subfamily)